MTVGVALLELLVDYGVDTVFGIPGTHTIELYRGIEATGMRHITARHEQGAAFMADGYAWATGRPGVCVLIGGPGVTNAVTAIAQAYRDSRPLLVISSVATHPGAPHGLPDQRALTQSITVFSEVAHTPQEAAELIASAFRIFARERPRPCHIAMTPEMLRSRSPRFFSVPLPPKSQPEPGLVKQAVEMLHAARRPMVVLGGGAVDAGKQAAQLAAATGARIVTTGNAKGAVDPSLACYCRGGLSSEGVLNELATADVVLAVGTELACSETIPLGRQVDLSGFVIRVDLDEHEPIGQGMVHIRADAVTTLEQLASRAVHPKSRDPQRVPPSDLDHYRRVPHPEFAPWLDAIRVAVPLGSTMAVDSTQLGYHAHRSLPWSGSRTWFAPFSYGALGAAIPLAVGAKAGRPDRRAFAIAGDAGALFTFAELATAVDHSLPITAVVWNNAGYGEIREAMNAAGVKPVEPRTSIVDYVGLAGSLGCRAIRVTTPDELVAALSNEPSDHGAVVVDVQPEGCSQA